MNTMINVLIGLIVGYLIGIILAAFVAFVLGFEDAARFIAIGSGLFGAVLSPFVFGLLRVDGGGLVAVRFRGTTRSCPNAISGRSPRACAVTLESDRERPNWGLTGNRKSPVPSFGK